MKYIKAIYWRVRIALLALRWIGSYNLGDAVWYRGQKWMLIQGVAAPTWSLARNDERVDAHERDFRKVMTPRNLARSFISGYRFYMTSWYRIWMREGIQPWMRSLPIWKRSEK